MREIPKRGFVAPSKTRVLEEGDEEGDEEG